VAWLSDDRPRWPDGNGLLPVIVQDATDGTVLMLGWATAEALELTERTGDAHFWSRSRERLWRKGETSGNVLHVADLATDCDGDAILYRIHAAGPACHTGRRTCFAGADATGTLRRLEAVIAERRSAGAEESYTARLLTGGSRKPAEKVVEEAGEAAVAALAGTDDEVAGEAADLLYHLLVLLASRDVPLADVIGVLEARRSGESA
jgi:phosphoribosyl-AMP cyclohydrolase / phosphoribosyl-ATP pyrophosphohydrolase